MFDGQSSMHILMNSDYLMSTFESWLNSEIKQDDLSSKYDFWLGMFQNLNWIIIVT
jgi:hypothetical protein